MKYLRTIELKYADLKAAALCKAKQDVRFYLCGVFVGKGVVAATNGHILLICEEPEAADIELIIPAEAIDSLVRKGGSKPKNSTVLLHELEDGLWLFNHAGTWELFRPVEGKYPSFERVDIKKPESFDGQQYPQFNFDYLVTFNKIAKIYGKTFPALHPTTEKDSAYIEINDRVHGVIMPLRF